MCKKLYFCAKLKTMKKLTLLGFLLICLSMVSCKSDKKAENSTASETGMQSEATEPKEQPYKAATLQELSGAFADANFPDKGFWKKFIVKVIAGEKVEVTFTSSTIAGAPACSFRGIGDFRNGYIQTPVNPGSAEPTFLTIRMLVNNEIVVGAEGGSQSNPSDVLSLFCLTPTTTSIGGIYKRVKE